MVENEAKVSRARKPAQEMSAVVCSFKRVVTLHDNNTETGAPQWEKGIAVMCDGDVWVITDRRGQVISGVWDYRLEWEKGTFKYEIKE